METKEAEKLLSTKRISQRDISYKRSDFLSTGSTLLNLACSDRPYGGFIKGHYYRLVGDSTSGKTFLSLTCLAEASINKNFDDYRFIYDNSEHGALMNIEKFFGKGVAERLEPPQYAYAQSGIECPIYSSTIEEFYYHVDDAIKVGTPFIYILDSMDSLTSDSERDKFQEQKKAHRSGKTTAGSYGDGKAKINSGNLRTLLTPLKQNGSILIIISQTRDNLGSIFGGKTSSGGKATKFYACMELWSSVKNSIKRTIRGKDRELGVNSKIQIRKNRLNGKERTVVVPIYHSFGIDDIGSCVDYLIDEKVWTQKSGIVNAKQWGLKGRKEKIIKYIENNNKELKLKNLVTQVWKEIEDACKIERKKKY